MKKLVSFGLACSILLCSVTPAVLAADEEPLLIAPAPAVYTVTINNEKVDLTNKAPFEENGIVMVPLRAMAEKLGYEITWEEDTQGIHLDDGITNTTIYIGKDVYYTASSFAIGMSAPSPIGAAPVLVNDLTFVPVEMFKILNGNDGVTVDGTEISITKHGAPSDSGAQIPNPFTEYKSIDDAVKALSFKPVLPPKSPEGYTLSYIATLGSDFIELIYENGDKQLTYRTALGSDDISGDYNVYENTKTVKIANADVTVRLGDKSASAIWTDNGQTFSIIANFGMTESEATALVLSALK